jgi:hypothetical protein
VLHRAASCRPQSQYPHRFPDLSRLAAWPLATRSLLLAEHGAEVAADAKRGCAAVPPGQPGAATSRYTRGDRPKKIFKKPEITLDSWDIDPIIRVIFTDL